MYITHCSVGSMFFSGQQYNKFSTDQYRALEIHFVNISFDIYVNQSLQMQ